MITKSTIQDKYMALWIFFPIFPIFSMMISIYNEVIGAIVILSLIILYLVISKRIMDEITSKWRKDFYCTMTIGISIIIFTCAIIPFGFPIIIYELIIAVALIIILIFGYKGFIKLYKERKLSIKDTILFYDDSVNPYLDRGYEENCIAKFKENKSMYHNTLITDITVIFIVISLIFVILIVGNYYSNRLFDNLEILFAFILLILFIPVTIFLGYRIRKKLPEIKREIFLNDKEIRVPLRHNYNGLFLEWGFAANMSGRMKYEDIEGYTIDDNAGSIDIKSKKFTFKLFLSKTDILKMIGIIDKHIKN